LPAPATVLRLPHAQQPARTWLAGLDAWLEEQVLPADARCLVSPVHARAADQLWERLAAHRWSELVRLTREHIPIEVRLEQPQRVGVDRLLGAVAVNRLRKANTPAMLVDMGTAVTVNLVAADGAFEGGAILPGRGTALAALHASTTSLPLRTAADLAVVPPVVGKSTDEAMAAGAFWGTLGAIRELVGRIAGECATTPQLFLTGGGSEDFAPLVMLDEAPARHVPHLVLSGIRVVADDLPTP
jgi:type III pantothenate kinase